MKPKPLPVTCPKCGQVGNQPPGLKLGEYEHLGAVFVGDDLIPGITPQKLTCQSCGHHWPVLRGSIEVKPANK